MPHKTYLYIILGIAAFVLAAAAGYHFAGKPGPAQQIVQPPMPAGILLDFSRNFNKIYAATEAQTLPQEEFLAPDGRSVRISDFEGDFVLVNFWATWCAPCVVELPSLKRFAEHYRGKIKVIGVALDPAKTHVEIQEFLKKRELGDFAGYYDQRGDFGTKMKLRGIPTSFLIGKDGLILYRLEGDADWTSAETKRFFDVILNDSSAPNR